MSATERSLLTQTHMTIRGLNWRLNSASQVCQITGVTMCKLLLILQLENGDHSVSWLLLNHHITFNHYIVHSQGKVLSSVHVWQLTEHLVLRYSYHTNNRGMLLWAFVHLLYFLIQKLNSASHIILPERKKEARGRVDSDSRGHSLNINHDFE